MPHHRLIGATTATLIAATALASLTAGAAAATTVTKACGTIHYRLEGGHESGTVKTKAPTCATARAVLKKATHKSFDFGDTLAGGKHYRCQASQRPEASDHPTYVVTCSHRGKTAIAFGITST